jgi:hypothetical protein
VLLPIFTQGSGLNAAFYSRKMKMRGMFICSPSEARSKSDNSLKNIALCHSATNSGEGTNEA